MKSTQNTAKNHLFKDHEIPICGLVKNVVGNENYLFQILKVVSSSLNSLAFFKSYSHFKLI